MEQKDKLNPWLKIPHDDYEAHMSDPNVQQLYALSKIFNYVLEKYSPQSIAVLGCAGGNGFEHLVNRKFNRVVGIDINPDYLNICENRFSSSIPNLELICSDLTNLELDPELFDLIHAALIFEYIDVEIVLKKISNWLKPKGVLAIVFQITGEISAPVSETKFKSLKLLSDKIVIVDAAGFQKLVKKNKLTGIYSDIIELKHGKNFWFNVFEKRNTK
jgi:SAM-dependent methyltransferase